MFSMERSDQFKVSKSSLSCRRKDKLMSGREVAGLYDYCAHSLVNDLIVGYSSRHDSQENTNNLITITGNN